MAIGSLIFFGTAETAIPFLDELLQHYSIALVVTQPDSVGGRHKQCLESPVKCYAREHHLDLIQPGKLKNPALVERIRAIDPLIAVVIAYGKWIPAAIHSLPRFRAVNVHFSLLPRYRGAAPVQRAIQDGETLSGITIFELTAAMDAGDIWTQMEMAIGPHETSHELFQRMSRTGPPFLIETLERIFSGRIQKRPQDHTQATSAPPLRKEEGKIDWQRPAREIYNRFRAYFPWPGLFFSIPGRIIKVTRASVSALFYPGRPGEILSLDQRNLKVCCGGQSVLEIYEIQPPGKNPMTPYSFSLGNSLPPVLP